MKIADTNILNDINKAMYSNNINWDPSLSSDVIKMTLESVSEYLGQVKKKSEPVGIKINDDRGNFCFGAFVTFIPMEVDETKGNYNLTFTFDESDMKEVTKTVDQRDSLFRHVFYSVGSSEKYKIRFEADAANDWIGYAICVCMTAIKTYLEKNYKLDPQVVMDDFFTASAELDGEKIYVAITPSAVLKQHIKDDASIETEQDAQ